jgi:aspartate-semialdehyde dehydrogenase
MREKLTAQEVRELLADAPGVAVLDNVAENLYPTPLHCEGKDETFVGRIRQDISNPNAIDMWVVSDNLRKGAALNAVQIAEEMMRRGLLKPVAAA